MEALINAKWDDEAGVWVASSDTIPGFVMEAETEEELVREAETLIPELLALNAHLLREPIKGVAIAFVKVRVLALNNT